MSETFVAHQLASSKVVIFSKSYCPYCKAAKANLDSNLIPFLAIELDQIPNGKEVQSYLGEITGLKTVPNIFINKKHFGDDGDLEEGLLDDRVATLISAA